MIVKMQNDGHSITGIRMRISDARRLFPSDVKAVDLELDHLRIRCDLRIDRPQISDPRLCLWLEEKLFWRTLQTTPVLQMERTGDSYRLEVNSRPARLHSKPVLQASQGPCDVD